MFMKLKYLYALPFIAFAIWALILCTANLLAYHASQYEDKWYKTGTIKDKNSWDSAYHSLKIAIALDPYNPDYLEMMGKLYVWRYSIDNTPITSKEEAEALHKEGLEYLRMSVYKRPTSLQIHAIKKDLDEALEDIKNEKL